MKTLSGLQLKSHLITQLKVDYNFEFFSSDNDVSVEEMMKHQELDIDFDCYRRKDGVLTAHLSFSTGYESNKNAYPIKYAFQIYGNFDVNEEILSDEELKKLLPLNPVAMLYGIARGILSPIFIQGLVPQYTLPTINFTEVLKQKIEKEKAKSTMSLEEE
ncbi:protein-export chaperone SecB [bacterium]|nr:protein-export chaperone SecB [bacterium]